MRPELEDTAIAPATPAAAAAVDRTVTHTDGARPAAAAPGLASGQQLGHFRIERRLGAGGMGEVYLATDLALDRPVAVKVLPEALARDPKLRDRLIREARAQARVVHPNVAHIYFVGEEAGRLFFAMELIAGQTLAERIATAPLPVDDALAVIRAAVLGLREAQRSGFTHRDVKPSNLMLDAHGVLKVLDFGLAASGAGEACGEPDSAAPQPQTSLAGTPLYMAPEQARGGAVDFRADIYALGVTLFHLVAGKPPFVADSIGELVTLHASASRPALPRRGQPRTQIGAIDALCTRMMAARPEDRFASYDELLRAIDIASRSHTHPGGFWVRAIASSLDALLVLIVVNGALVLSELLGAPELEEMPVILTALLLWNAYTVARWGSTPGKSMFELEVADVGTLERPSPRRALRRALVLYGPTAAALWVKLGADWLDLRAPSTIALLVTVISVPLGFAVLLYAATRISGKRALWDRWSGTMVRYRTARPAGPLAHLVR